jgi:NADH-quinone oxidoreductase subunit E
MEQQIRQIISRYGSDKSFLVPVLQDVQRELNYLPEEALQEVARQLDVPVSRVFEVATFYKAFSLTPRGKHLLSLCLGTACHVRGAPLVSGHIERVLGIKPGETTADLQFTFETVNCLGACALGPIIVADGEYHGQVTIAKTNTILRDLGLKVSTDEEA